MNFSLFELLYNIPELQDLSYQIYRQMPERISRAAQLNAVWKECMAVPDPEIQDLFFRLEDAIHFDGLLQDKAAFFAGVHLARELMQALG